MILKRRRRLSAGKPAGGKRRLLIICACVLLVLAVCLVTADCRIKSLAYAQAEVQAHKLCIKAVNDATSLAVESCSYCDLIEIDKNAQNGVTAVMADVSALNALKVSVSSKIEEFFEELDGEKISIPLGTLTNSTFLTGKGPDVNVTLTLSGSSELEIRSEFESVGINQTRHRVVMDVRCEVYIVMLERQSVKEIALTVPIAETVIVGSVPNTYFKVD